MFDIAELRQVFGWDPETGEIWWNCHPSSLSRARGLAGSLCANGYIQIRYRGRAIKAHRLIWALHYGEWPSNLIDHRDRVKNNNCIANLRVADHSQNNANLVRVSPSSSAFKGVYWYKARSVWRARIGVKKTKIFLGEFTSELDAALAYDRAAIELYGEWARPNFPKPSEVGNV